MEPDLEPSKANRGFLRRLFRRAGPAELSVRREATVLAFASGKGGTGKSFLSTSVAIALHRAGRRVVVVDCDFGLANAHLLFGITPTHTMRHMLDGIVPVQQIVQQTPFGPSLVAGGSGISSLAELDVHQMGLIGRALGWLAACHDVVLLDCAAGLSPQAMVMTLAAQYAVIVTNPEIAALTDAYALIKCLARQPGCPALHLAVNRVSEPGLGTATFERLAEVSRRFAGCQIHYGGEVPEDPAVTQRRLGQPPLVVSHPECRTSQAVNRIVNALELQTGGLSQRPITGAGIDARMAAHLRRW